MKKKQLILFLLAFMMVSCTTKSNDSSPSSTTSSSTTQTPSTTLEEKYEEEKRNNDLTAEGIFLNGRRVTTDEVDEQKISQEDVKTVEKYDNYFTLNDYAWGYQINLPTGLAYDFTLNEVAVKAENSRFNFRISQETAFYSDFSQSMTDLYKFYDDELYLEGNDIENITSEHVDKITISYDYEIRIMKRAVGLSFRQNNIREVYYINIHIINQRRYGSPLHALFYKFYDIENMEVAIDSINSFVRTSGSNNPVNNTNFTPKIEESWNEQTKEIYQRITSSNEIGWGLFTPRHDYDYKLTDDIEKEIEYQFPVMMTYRNITAGGATATRAMAKDVCNNIKKAWDERGQLTMLTLHATNGNNVATVKVNESFDILDGKYDGCINAWASVLKELQIPVLIRFSNEMNADWTTYSGPMMLSDPNAYVEMYRYTYDKFIENGVNNTLWIFNPFDRQYPVYNWNHLLAYYPGNEYVQFAGLTGYNAGTAGQWGEWKSFETIYRPLGELYSKHFNSFSWVIGEFGSSSSANESKPAWIAEMFEKMSTLLPNLKIAVWFNYADFYTTPDFEFVCTTYYWLDETPECLQAFKEGIKATVPTLKSYTEGITFDEE